MSSHPNIAKITRQIEVIDGYYAALLYYEAWGFILVVMRGLKPDHKQRDDFKELMKDIQYGISRINRVRFMNAYDAATKRIQLAAKLDKEFHSRFMSLLWECNMLSESAYSYYDPTQKKSSDKTDVDIGDRDTSNLR